MGPVDVPLRKGGRRLHYQSTTGWQHHGGAGLQGRRAESHLPGFAAAATKRDVYSGSDRLVVGWTVVSAVSTGDAARPAPTGSALGEPKRQRDCIAQSITIGDRFADSSDHADGIAIGIAIGIGNLVTDAGADSSLDAGSVSDLTKSAL